GPGGAACPGRRSGEDFSADFSISRFFPSDTGLHRLARSRSSRFARIAIAHCISSIGFSLPSRASSARGGDLKVAATACARRPLRFARTFHSLLAFRCRVAEKGADADSNMRTVRRLSGAPLLILLPLQALLLFWRLDRLPAWGDEEMTLRVCAAPAPEALQLLANDIHPPLYFWLARIWLHLPWTGDPIVSLRGLSALLALITGAIVYARWVARREAATRWWFAALWVSSPFLLL